MNLRRHALIIGLLPMLLTHSVWASPPSTPSPQHPQTTAGSLTIQAVQGTPDGPAIANTDIEISLHTKNAVIQTINTQLDEHGGVSLNDIPIDTEVRPVIRIEYAGVTYQEVGEIMSPANPQQSVNVTCYQVTNDTPLWSMPMRQVMLSHSPQGIKVTEILMVMNPDERTWLGTESAPNQPTTMSLRLPQGAEQIQLGTGFHDWCCTSVQANTLINHLPMMPGTTEMNFSYIINTQDGTMELDFVAPAAVEQMAVMLPNDIHTHRSEGLTLGGTRKIADTIVRFYTAPNLANGDAAHLSLSGLNQTRVVADHTTRRTPVTISPEMLTMIVGGGIVLLAGGVMAYQFKRKSSG